MTTAGLGSAYLLSQLNNQDYLIMKEKYSNRDINETEKDIYNV